MSGPAMFTLDEERLRAALTDGSSGLEAFDPKGVTADDLHGFVDVCLAEGIIERRDGQAAIAVYPQAGSDPIPLLSVNPGEGPVLLGKRIPLDYPGDELTACVLALRQLVGAANRLYLTSEVAKHGLRGSAEDDRCENCLRVHGVIHACLFGVLAGCIEGRERIAPPTPQELAAIEVDPIWDDFGSPAIDRMEELIEEIRAEDPTWMDEPGFFSTLASLSEQRVRLTYENGVRVSGEVTVHDLNGSRDVRIDGHGGFGGDAATVIEVMGTNGRYSYRCDGPAARRRGPLGRIGYRVNAAMVVETRPDGPGRLARCVGCGATQKVPGERAPLPRTLTCTSCRVEQPVMVLSSNGKAGGADELG